MRGERMRLSALATSTFCCALLGALAPSADSRADELKIGDRAPDFTATSLDDKPLKLSSFQGDEGKNVVLVFNRGHW